MHKAGLIEAIKSRLSDKSITHDQVVEVVEAFFDVIIREVARNDRVTITGFGVFKRVDRAARTGRNPHTGSSVSIDEKVMPRFVPAKAFEDYVSDPGTLPDDRSVGKRRPAETD